MQLTTPIATSRPPTGSFARPRRRAPSSSCCPRNGPCSGRASRWRPARRRSTAVPIGWARETALALGIDLVAGSLFEDVPDDELGANTSVHVGPDGELQGGLSQDPPVRLRDRDGLPVRGIVDRAARATRSSSRNCADGTKLGLTHLLRRALPRAVPDRSRSAARGYHRARRVHAATTRDHWRRWCARGRSRTSASWSRPIRSETTPATRSGGRSLIVDPWGLVLAGAPDRERRSSPSSTSGRDRRRPTPMPVFAHRRPARTWDGA